MARGGGGNRTRVTGRPSGSSPGASGGEISPRASHRRRGPRPARVRCPSEAPGRNLLGEACLRCPVRAAGPPGRTATYRLGSERVLFVGACVVPAFYETPEISARFSQAITALLEASTPPYVVVTRVYGARAPQLKRAPSSRTTSTIRSTSSGRFRQLTAAGRNATLPSYSVIPKKTRPSRMASSPILRFRSSRRLSA
jgi:hypothetical protein